jgi:hypothetical protein
LAIGSTALSYVTAAKLTTFSYVVVSYLAGITEAILGPSAIMLISISTEKWLLNKFFIFWGKNSLILMVTHYSILLEICIILNTHWTGSSKFTGMNTIYFFVATIILEYPMVYFINSRAKFLLGK